MYNITRTIILLIICAKGSHGFANITDVPYNITEAIDGNATFVCGVTGQQTMEQSVYWHMLAAPAESTPPVLVSYNALSRDDKKYIIEGRYHLNILNIALEDEGVYECKLGEFAYLAGLTVVAPPSRFYVELANNVSQVQSGERVTLICHAEQSRPPSEKMRWYKGNMEMTDDAKMECNYPDENGYGSCKSTVEMMVTDYDFFDSILCVVDLPDYPAITVHEFTLPSDATQRVVSVLMLVYSAMVATLKYKLAGY